MRQVRPMAGGEQEPRAEPSGGGTLATEELLVALTTALLDPQDAGHDRTVANALGVVARYAGAERASVLRLGRDRTTATRTHLWDGSDRASPGPCPHEVSLPELRAMGLNGRTPRTLLGRRGSRRDGRTVIAIPLVGGDDVLGVLALESANAPGAVLDQIMPVLRAAAHLLSNALERRRLADALRESADRYRELYDQNPSMCFTIDAAGTLRALNSAAAAQLGYEVTALGGRSFFDLFGDADRGGARAWLRECLSTPESTHRSELRMRHRDGRQIWVKAMGRASERTPGQRVVFMACEDVTEAHLLSAQLSYQASHDALTDLVNRREFERRLARVLETARREGSEHALCYLDLDQFKVINDSCGHLAGDELLRQIGEVLRQRVRRRDTLARLGGDEFGVLVEHCSIKQAQRIANALRKAIDDFRFNWEEKTFVVGVSVGLVPITARSRDMNSVLRAADAACYAAKDAGRNRVHLYREKDAERARRGGQMRWVERIGDALDQNAFRLALQRVHPLQGQAVQGDLYEVLLRMQDGSGPSILPGAFLPAAERYELMTRIDFWVVDAVIDWIARRPARLPRPDTCFVNLSANACSSTEFADHLEMRLHDGLVPPGILCFELREGAMLGNLAVAIRFMKRMKRLGVRFAVDDFGSGVSSFAYLRHVPVDFLKIDGSLVKDIVGDTVHQAMVRSINDIAHAMGIRTVAECVETGAALERVRGIGVDYAQGYVYEHPRLIRRRPG